jgi:hypothetical protein
VREILLIARSHEATKRGTFQLITEIASITIDPTNAAAFEAIIEDPAQYRLLVIWDSVEAHMAFRETPALQEWRGLAGPFFAAPPSVVHSAEVGRYF